MLLDGGEPLLRKDLTEIIRYAVRVGVTPHLSTNGLLLDCKTVKKLRKAGLQSIQVSLDGAFSETHNFIRGYSESYDSAIAAIQNARQGGLSVTVNTVLMKHNIKEIPGIINLLIKMKVDFYRVASIVPVNETLKKLCVSTQEFKDLLSFLVKSKRQIRDNLQIILPSNKLVYILDEKADSNIMLSTSLTSNIGCEAGTFLCNITPDGWVTPCVYFSEEQFRAGNIRREKLASIWSKSPIFRAFRNLKLARKCMGCSYLMKCKGGCRALAFYFFGSLKEQDPRCWI